MAKTRIVNGVEYPDNYIDTPDQADWTKQTWDLPPYKSNAFYAAIGGPDQLAHFKTLPVYKYARQRGRINDNDQWVEGTPLATQRPAQRSEDTAITETYAKALDMVTRGETPDVTGFSPLNALPEAVRSYLVSNLKQAATAEEVLIICSDATEQLLLG